MHLVLLDRSSHQSRFILWGGLLVLLGCTPQKSPKPLTVFAASSLQGPLEEIQKAWFQQSGLPVRVHYASSSTLARQIELGAHTSLLLSASQLWLESICKNNPRACSTPQAFAGNHLAVLGTTQTIKSPAQTLRAVLLSESCFTVGDWEHVPVGIYVKEALKSLRLWELVKPKLVPAKDALSAFGMMLQEACPFNLGYINLASLSPNAQVITKIPTTHHKPIEYWAIQIENPKNNAAALFQNFLMQPTSQAAFIKHGFTAAQHREYHSD